LPIACSPPILAVGGQLKNTFALGRGDQAILSQHLGDLDHLEAYRAFERDIRLYQELFQIAPEVIVHDLHPDYASTRYALRRAAADATKLIGVQHHHAHLASCMAEHGVIDRAIGVTFDGTGYGTDATIWGGEFLIGDYCGFDRAAHLRCVAMPGGEQAIREPWRMAVAHLLDAGCSLEPLCDRVNPPSLSTVSQMISRRFQSPLTSSMGRLFDAVAAIAGVRESVSFEGQAAIELERAAEEYFEHKGYSFTLGPGEWNNSASTPLVIDPRPVIRSVVADLKRGEPPGRIARRFHLAVASMIETVCGILRQQSGISTVALSGGTFLNALLASDASQRLTRAGFRVLRHSRVPPGDGGLCLGQLAIAAAATAGAK
jgi:hydrogenase maturation protein HypF